jgi:hypothetical protein
MYHSAIPTDMNVKSTTKINAVNVGVVKMESGMMGSLAYLLSQKRNAPSITMDRMTIAIS